MIEQDGTLRATLQVPKIASTSNMHWASWQQDVRWSRWHTAMLCQSKQSRKH